MKRGLLKIGSIASLALFIISCSEEVRFEEMPLAQTTALDQSTGDNPIISEPEIPGTYILKTDRFFQGATSRPVDILFVVDNSPSMAEEQTKMGQRISSFLNRISQVDWQIGITTTDVSNGTHGLKGRLLDIDGQHFIRKSDPSAQQKFLSHIQRKESLNCFGNCPSSDEQPLAATILAVEKSNDENSGFFRDGADLAVVILTDEDEMSYGPANATTANDVISRINNRWKDKNFRGYTLAIRPNDQDCKQKNLAGFYGDLVSELPLLTGGVLGDICAEDYGAQLSEIGNSVLQLSRTFILHEQPVPGSIKVELKPEQPGISWSLNGRGIVFSEAPQIGTEVKVDYKVDEHKESKDDDLSEEDESEDD